ncbi:MAG: hypothetical protein JST51_13205 [Armatimonadetes bacterium]|nr:hypothetical protein [Armatimonadota bacterium]
MKLTFLLVVTSFGLGCQQPPTPFETQGAGFQTPVPIANDWNPPTKSTIPANYLTATKSLLGNGLADPRGGKFHKVSVMLGNATGWGNQSIYEKQGYGWIMPDHQVVLIDGLKYPLKADLGVANPADLFPPSKTKVFGNFTTDGIEIQRATIAMPALLLVRGETGLAEQCWDQVGAHQFDPVLNFYAELTYRYYMQTAQCLIERRDADALPWAKKLALVSDLREKAGVNYGKDTVGWRFDPNEAGEILHDVARRVAHPKSPFDLKANAKLDQPARITGLIDALDEVSAKQWGQPGGINWSMDPIIKAITQEGSAAVPALLDAMENDDRMTRSVSFGRDFFPARTLHTVRTAAYQCLMMVWPSSSTVRNDEPKDRVAKLRALWKTSANLSEPERWLNVLRDDQASRESWLRAAQSITDPLHVIRQGQGGMSVLPNKSEVMHGEPLRERHGKEIAALMNKRIEALTKVAEFSSSMQLFEFADGLSIAHCLYRWDKEGVIPSLKAATDRTIRMMKEWKQKHNDAGQMIARPFGKLIADRSNSGDKTAGKDYAEAVQLFTFESFEARDVLSPLWRCPTDATVQAAGAIYLARIASETSDNAKPRRFTGIFPIDDLLQSPMLISPEFRKFLVQSMDSTREIGKFSVRDDPNQGQFVISYGNNGGGSMALPKSVSVAGYLVKDQPLTAGGLIVQTVASSKGAPPFLLSWPEPKRSEAKGQIVAWLEDSRVDWVAVVRANPFSNMDFDY